LFGPDLSKAQIVQGAVPHALYVWHRALKLWLPSSNAAKACYTKCQLQLYKKQQQQPLMLSKPGDA